MQIWATPAIVIEQVDEDSALVVLAMVKLPRLQQKVLEVLAGSRSREDLRKIEPKARRSNRRYTYGLGGDEVKPGAAFMPFHWSGTNRLTFDALDPVSKIPAYKIVACRIEVM